MTMLPLWFYAISVVRFWYRENKLAGAWTSFFKGLYGAYRLLDLRPDDPLRWPLTIIGILALLMFLTVSGGLAMLAALSAYARHFSGNQHRHVPDAPPQSCGVVYTARRVYRTSGAHLAATPFARVSYGQEHLGCAPAGVPCDCRNAPLHSHAAVGPLRVQFHAVTEEIQRLGIGERVRVYGLSAVDDVPNRQFDDLAASRPGDIRSFRELWPERASDSHRA